MKIAVVKLGARVSYSSQGTSGGTGEAISIINMLKSYADVTVFTKILKKDKNPDDVTFVDIEDDCNTANFDALVVINGSVNFFGGAEDWHQIMNYKIINEFDGPIFYTYCDPELTLRNIWPSVSVKEWASNWKQEDIELKNEEIIWLCQPYNTDFVQENLKKNVVFPKKLVHFPFEKFPCMNERLPFNENPSVDLSYGGTMRGGKRIEKMVKFYFGHEKINVEMFGKIELKDFPKKKLINNPAPPKFTGPVKYDQMLTKMNDALAHVVIGDPFYEKSSDVAQRTYESIWSSVVTFIDADLDKEKRVYGKSPILSDFLYVSSRKDVEDKILALKGNKEIRKQIVDLQFKTVNFDKDAYCKSFIDTIKEEI